MTGKCSNGGAPRVRQSPSLKVLDVSDLAMSDTNHREQGTVTRHFSVANALDSGQRRPSAKGTSFQTYGARLAAGNGRAHWKNAPRNVIAAN